MNTHVTEQTDGFKLSKTEHARQQAKRARQQAMSGYLFLLPWIFGILAFVASPLVYSLYISFHRVKVAPDGSGLQYDYIGLSHYKYAFVSDNIFPVEIFLFMREMIIVVPVTVIFALLVSLMLNQQFKGRMIFRTVFFLPVIFATGQVLLGLFDQGQGSLPFGDQYDVKETLYTLLPETLAATIMDILGKFIIILWFSGVQVIMFIASFQTISRSVYEAAQIDGVTLWESFWKITFPAIVPFIILNLIYTLVEQSLNPFNPILKHIVKNMSEVNTGYGYASALSWIYFSFILIPVGILVYIAGKQNKKKGGI